MTKVVIEVSGGCVVSVVSDNKEVEYVVVDYDNIKQGDAPPDMDSFTIADYAVFPLASALASLG